MPFSEPQHAAIAASSSGDNTIVAAASGRRIRVLAYTLVATSPVTAAFESDAGGTALTGDMPLAANGVLVAPYNPGGWFETVAGELLNLELGAAVVVAGSITYVFAD